MFDAVRNPIVIAELIFFAALIALAWEVMRLRKKMSILMGDDIAGEDDLRRDLMKRVIAVEEKSNRMEPRTAVLESIAARSIQKVGFLRFNPFQDTGGDQSFVLVLLDRENNGVVLSSLYTREGARVFAKEVSGGKSRQQLSAEEGRVLAETMEKKY